MFPNTMGPVGSMNLSHGAIWKMTKILQNWVELGNTVGRLTSWNSAAILTIQSLMYNIANMFLEYKQNTKKNLCHRRRFYIFPVTLSGSELQKFIGPMQ